MVMSSDQIQDFAERIILADQHAEFFVDLKDCVMCSISYLYSEYILFNPTLSIHCF